MQGKTPKNLPQVLLVDDDPANVEALSRILRSEFALEAFTHPGEALKAFEVGRFSVVISDQRMPEMKGSEFLGQIANQDPLVTRVILTAFTEVHEILEAINRAEVYRYIAKPWEAQELLTTIRQAAEYHRLKKHNLVLIEDLQKKNLALSQMTGELEKLVEERTADLKTLNEKLSSMAMTDPLTKLPNRRVFFQKFGEEIERSLRYEHSIAIAMVDVDHFKPFNDMEGHVFGDEALKKVAQTLLKNLRKTDLIARYGGEEFIVMMTETGLGVAQEICERLRVAIETSVFQGKEKPAYLTISIGLAGFPMHGNTPTELVEAADRALYEAKSSGRNRVECQKTHGAFFIP